MREKILIPAPRSEAAQMVRVEIGPKGGSRSIRVSFTNQRLIAHGGMLVWSRFLHQNRFGPQLCAVLPHVPASSHACDPNETVLGFFGGILAGADKLTRLARLRQDPAIAEALGIEGVPSQSTLSHISAAFVDRTGEELTALHY